MSDNIIETNTGIDAPEVHEKIKKAIAKNNKKAKELKDTSSNDVGVGGLINKLRKGGMSFATNSGDTKYFSLGHFGLNYIMSGSFCGERAGIQRKRLIESYGPSGSMKSVIMYTAIKEFQKSGGIVAIADTEGAHNDEFLSLLGLDTSECVFLHPKDKRGNLCFTVDSTFQSLFDFVIEVRKFDANIPILVCLDSLAACPSQDEWEQVISNADVKEDQGRRAKRIGVYQRSFNNFSKSSDVTFFVINQLRASLPKPGMMSFGPSEVTTGGKATEYYSDIRIDTRKKTSIFKVTGKAKDSKRKVGRTFKITCDKNRVTQPDRSVTVDFLFNYGTAPLSGLFDLMLDEQFIYQKSPGRYCAVEPSSRNEIQLKLKDEKTFRKKEFESGTWFIDNCELFGLNKQDVESVIMENYKAHDYWMHLNSDENNGLIIEMEDDGDDDTGEISPLKIDIINEDGIE